MLPAFASLVIVASAALLLIVAATLPERSGRWDFSIYYASALMMRRGGNPYLESIAPIGRRLGLETTPIERADSMPTFVLCFEPLTRFSPRTAYWIWFWINLAALVGALAILLAPAAAGLYVSAALVVLAIIFPPVAIHFFWEQSQFIVLLALAAAYRLSARGYDSGAALAIASAALLRLFPLAMIGYFIVRRRWRVIGWLGVWLTLGAAATVAGIGAPRCLSYAGVLLALGGRDSLAMPAILALSPTNVSLAAFVSRPLYWLAGPDLPAALGVMRYIAIALGEFAVLFLTVRATCGPNSDRDGRGFALWTAALLMLAPVVWLHYLVLLIIPYLLGALAWMRGRMVDHTIRAAAVSCILIAIVTPALDVLDYRATGFPAMLAAESGFIAMCSAYAFAYRFAVQDRA